MLPSPPRCLVLLSSAALTACVVAGVDDGPGGPGGKADHAGDECGYSVDFDQSDPNDYLWTVRVAEIWTLPVFNDRAEIHFRRFSAGVDPETGDPAETGQIRTLRSGNGSLWAPAVLAEDVSYADLIDGSFRFFAVRARDKFAMTSCVKQIEIADAVGSHNAILSNGYPVFDPAGYTNPDAYRDEEVSAKPGVVMLVDGDCTIPDKTNPDETRSVLSWLAVTLEARPNPQVIDPFVLEGIDFSRGKDEGDYCHDSPWDWTWRIKAFGAKTQVGNANDLPGDRGIKLDVNGRFWQDGLEADNVQVDPENGDLNAERGQIFTDYGGREVTTLELDELLDGEGIEFRIRRDDFGADLSYARCRAVLDIDRVALAYYQPDHRLHLVKSVEDGAPRNHIGVVECTDGWFNNLGLHYLDFGLEPAERIADHDEPERPDLSEYVAGQLREEPPLPGSY